MILKVEGDIQHFIGGYDDLIKKMQVETSEKNDQ